MKSSVFLGLAAMFVDEITQLQHCCYALAEAGTDALLASLRSGSALSELYVAVDELEDGASQFSHVGKTMPCLPSRITIVDGMFTIPGHAVVTMCFYLGEESGFDICLSMQNVFFVKAGF